MDESLCRCLPPQMLMNDMPKNSLLPCPFCGGTHPKHFEFPSWDDMDHLTMTYSVFCQDCVASTSHFLTKQEAIQAWNRRPDDQCAEWLRQDDTYTRYECSACHSRNNPGSDKYYPNCGRRMMNHGGISRMGAV